MIDEFPLLLPHSISFKDLETLATKLITKYNILKEDIIIYEVNGIEGDIEIILKNKNDIYG